MNRFWTLPFALVLLAAPVFAQEPAQSDDADAPALESVKEKASYAFGRNVGRSVRAGGYDIDIAAFTKGLAEAIADTKASLTDQEMADAITAFEGEAATARAERQRIQAENNLKEGREFLAANKEKEGVKTLESGLQYKVIKSGSGKNPTAKDTIRAHYHGTLLDGTVFDSSVEREEPIEIEVSGVIRGWTEALQLMKVGDKWQLFIPSELAYGERGAGDTIGPNAVLIFDVELLEIVGDE